MRGAVSRKKSKHIYLSKATNWIGPCQVCSGRRAKREQRQGFRVVAIKLKVTTMGKMQQGKRWVGYMLRKQSKLIEKLNIQISFLHCLSCRTSGSQSLLSSIGDWASPNDFYFTSETPSVVSVFPFSSHSLLFLSLSSPDTHKHAHRILGRCPAAVVRVTNDPFHSTNTT